MARPALSNVERRLRQAHRRMVGQRLLNGVMVAWIAALAVGAIWFALEALIIESPAPWLRWAILGASAAVATLLAMVWGWRRSPTRQQVALTLDERFSLSERVTTALNLRDDERNSSAGQALLADAERKLADIEVGPRFPVRLRWPALIVPLQVVALLLLVLFPPQWKSSAQAVGKSNTLKKLADATKDAEKAGPTINNRPFVKPSERNNKSEELKQLEAELEKLLRQVNPDEKNAEVARDRIQKIDEMKDKLQKFDREQLQKFERLQEQMKSLDKASPKEMKDGPAKEFQDELKQGELKKAKADVDVLRKKLQDKKLSAEDKAMLADQMQDLQDRLEKLARDREREEKLKDLIQKAKQEGRDAEALERELKDVQSDLQQNAELEKMAEKLGECRKAMEKGDLDKAAEQLNELAKQLGDADDKLQDIEDVKEYLQRLKEARKGQCKACNGEGECDADGNPINKKNAKGRGRGAGERPDNPDAQTSSEDERIRSGFNPLGRKFYGGSTDGPAFLKKSTAEMAGEIQQAAQDAPEAAEVQKLPRAARDMVREYFERLGDQSSGKPKK